MGVRLHLAIGEGLAVFAIAGDVDYGEIALEESPLNELTYDDALTPSRISTNLLYPVARSFRIAPTPDHLSRADELRGIQGEVPRLIEGYSPVGILGERAYPKDLTWLFELAGFEGVRTAGNGVITDPDGATIPTGASRWVFNKRDDLQAKSARIKTNYWREGVQLQGYGFGVSAMSISAMAELSADWMGLFLRRIASDATVPVISAAAIPPFRRGDLYLSALAGGGRVADWSLAIANPIERVNSLSLDPPSRWPDALELAEGQVAVTGSIPKRLLDATDYDALVAATTFAMTARWKTPTNIGATNYKYSLWCQMPAAQYISGEAEELVGSRRRHGHSFDWFAAWDEAAGYDVRWTLVNDVTAIATFV